MKSYLKEISMLPVFITALPQSQGMDMARCLAKEDVKYLHIHRGILFSLKKKRENLLFVTTWMNLKALLLLHKSDLERPMLHDLALCVESVRQNSEEQSRMLVTRSSGVKERSRLVMSADFQL